MKQKNQNTVPEKHTDEPEVISFSELADEVKADELKEMEKNRPHVLDEQTAAGSTPNPEVVTAKTTLERANRVGMNNDEDNEEDNGNEESR